MGQKYTHGLIRTATKNLSPSLGAFVLMAFLIGSSSLYAQESPNQIIDLINRVSTLEAENRELRGLLEEMHHEVSLLTKRMETMSSDVDFRLNNSTAGGPAQLVPPSLPFQGNRGVPKDFSHPNEEYESARALLEQGEYDAAEHAFAAFVQKHPKDERAGAAQYWLGVTFFVRGQHEKAAAAFAKGYKNYPKSSKAADNLLKLSKSLAALDRKADACTTLDQLSTEHPKSHTRDVTTEKRKLGCK